MAHLEIERKFLVHTAILMDALPAEGEWLKQGYLNRDKQRTVRVRASATQGWLTIKGKGEGLARPEYEYPIPVEDARVLLDTLCEGVLEKTRYRIPAGVHVWEVDLFHGKHDGLVIAEIELSAENEAFDLPAWAAEEVTGDPRYYNSNLV